MTLGEAFPLEIDRVRELLRAYENLGPAGTFGAMMIGDVLRRAEKARDEHDDAAMVRLLPELEGCQ